MFLGIDLGTSELKALLLDDSQRIVATASAPLELQRPAPLHSEQHPNAWWNAADRALSELAQAQPKAMAAVRAIGLSGQMHGAVLLDAADQVQRPAILWNDGRSGAQCEALEAAEPRSRAITGNLAMPGFTAPKLLWLREHEPSAFARMRTVLLPKDWLRLRLTGEKVSEMSDASGTLWLDVGARRWSGAMLAASGMNESYMPRLVEGSGVSGQLRAEVAARWGLQPGIPVAGGGGDNAASAVGIGAIDAGQGFVSLGTSGVVFLAGEHFAPNPAQAVHAFCHALPQRWHQMSVMLSAGAALQWAARLLGLADVGALLALAATLPLARCARAPLFLPYLSGERTPHNDPHATGQLVGLTASHEAADIAHAVMEGVCLGLADGWQALGNARSGVEQLALVGGGARSGHWAQWLASALRVKLTRPRGADAGAALGAARLAAACVNSSQGWDELPTEVGAALQPDPAQAELLKSRHHALRAWYARAGSRPLDAPVG